MKKIILSLIAVAVIAGGGAIALKRMNAGAPDAAATKPASTNDSKDNASKTVAPQGAQSVPQVIELSASDLGAAETREVRRELPLTGQLRPIHQALMRARVAGEVIEMRVKEGETVVSGQVLARIDPMESRARLDERQATLAANKATWENNERTRKNNEELLRKGFISQSAYDTTLANSTVAQAQVKAAEANVALARRTLDDTTIKAPFAGLIAERSAQVGDKASVDMKLLNLVDLSRMEVEAGVPASEIPSVAPGQDVNFKVEGFGEQLFKGKIARINPQSQAGSRSIIVYVEVLNPDGALKGGMFAKGGLTLTRRDAVTAVPISALREERGETVVYAIENNRLARIPVKTGTRNEDEAWAEITASDNARIKPGIKVVKSNLGALNSGVEVKVTDGRSAPAAAVPVAAAPATAPTATAAVPPAAAAPASIAPGSTTPSAGQ